MAKKKAIKIVSEELTIEMFIDHYCHLRFQIWDGAKYSRSGPAWFVAEYLPENMEKGSNTKKQTKFSTKKDAEMFAAMKREEMANQLREYFEIEKPKPAFEQIEDELDKTQAEKEAGEELKKMYGETPIVPGTYTKGDNYVTPETEEGEAF